MITNVLLWHLAYSSLPAGTPVQPGSLGEKYRNGGLPSEQIHRESVLESVRAAQFPEKPSRLFACFAFDNIKTARLYQRLHFPNGILHEVQAIAIKYHVGNFSAIQPLPRRAESFEEMAARYWRNDLRVTLEEHPTIELTEIVIAGPLMVLRAI